MDGAVMGLLAVLEIEIIGVAYACGIFVSNGKQNTQDISKVEKRVTDLEKALATHLSTISSDLAVIKSVVEKLPCADHDGKIDALRIQRGNWVGSIEKRS